MEHVSRQRWLGGERTGDGSPDAGLDSAGHERDVKRHVDEGDMTTTDIETGNAPIQLAELHEPMMLGLRSGGTPEELVLLCKPSPEDQALEHRVGAANAKLASMAAKTAKLAMATATLPALLDRMEASRAAIVDAGGSDPDLLVRTAGEMRVSNYLLWQISYSEIWVTPKCWPDFDEATLHEACRAFAARDRRYGGLVNKRGAVG